MEHVISGPPRVLIAEDQPHVREALRLLLRTEGILSEIASSPDTVMHALGSESFDLLLMDLNYARDTTSGREGLDLLTRVQALDRSLPVVAMTGWPTLDLAVEAMRTGVRDFVQKPWENAQLIKTIRREIDRGRAERSLTRLHGRELEDAQHIQRGLLPQAIPSVHGWTIAADWKPANGLGGDYFDLIPFSQTRLGVCIADVVGKGLSAALLMSNLQGVVRAIASEHVPPADVCTKVNRVMSGKMDGGRFITFFYGVLDTAAGLFSWSNAGHNPGVIQHSDGSQDVLCEGGMVLGVFPDAFYIQRSLPVDPGDRIVLYTDGITEAEGPDDEGYGDERLRDLIAARGALHAAPLRDAIFSTVSEFCRGHFRDDATVIVLAGSSATRSQDPAESPSE